MTFYPFSFIFLISILCSHNTINTEKAFKIENKRKLFDELSNFVNNDLQESFKTCNKIAKKSEIYLQEIINKKNELLNNFIPVIYDELANILLGNEESKSNLLIFNINSFQRIPINVHKLETEDGINIFNLEYLIDFMNNMFDMVYIDLDSYSFKNNKSVSKLINEYNVEIHYIIKSTEAFLKEVNDLIINK